MYELRSTDVFESWLDSIKDWKARARLDAAQLGNLGDVKVVGGGIREMRVHVGAGYRIYFVQRGKVLLLLLCGGDKSTQSRDIVKAQRLLADID